MSEITNVNYGKKFESVDFKLTHEDAQNLYWLRCKAIYTGSKGYVINISESEYIEFSKIVAPLGRIL